MPESGIKIQTCPTTGQTCDFVDLCTERATLIDQGINPDNPLGSLGILPEEVDAVVSNPVACIQQHIRRLNLLGIRVNSQRDPVASVEVAALQDSAAFLIKSYQAS
jgi:hypothetical protein